MKQLFAVALLTVFPLTLAAQNPHMKVKQSGAFVQAQFAPDSLTSIQINVSRSSTNGVANTSMTFSSAGFSPDFSIVTVTNIFGTIPDSAFTGDNTRNLNVNLDTSTLDPTVSFAETCVVDLNLLTVTCNPATSGLIQLAFQENDVFRTQVLNSDTVTTVGPVVTRVRQKSDNSSANVSGSALGTSVSSTTAQVGVNHDTTTEVTRQ